jgi:YebC/PmpR family DNA-binding regulatory protein
MSGHSKWATIKRKKSASDAKRGKLWTKLLKEVTVAARLGGSNPDGDPRLRTAIQEAKSNNVPNANIERAIKKGAGKLEGADYEENSYEGYGPGGVAVLVETMSDNRNRTVADVRHLFSRFGGNLGETGCVSWIFTKQGLISIEREAIAEEELMDLAIEVGADDVSAEDEGFEVLTSPEDYHGVLTGLQEEGIALASHQLAMVPSTTVDVDAEHAPQLLQLLEALDDLDDVQHVWANFEIDAELLGELG